MRINQFFFKYCVDCGEKYKPTGKNQKKCEKCQRKKLRDAWRKKKEI